LPLVPIALLTPLSIGPLKDLKYGSTYTSMQCCSSSGRALLLEGSQVSPVHPSDKRGIKMQMNVKQWWNDTDRGNRSTGRKTCPIMIGVTWGEGYKRGKCPRSNVFYVRTVFCGC
jgi:hypothetical protein